MKTVRAAVGILRRADGAVFTQQRPPSSNYYAGYWEFPGGKIESGETPAAALARELREEVGITVTAAAPWLRRRHQYEHALVELHFFRVSAWRGEVASGEGQRWQWRAANDKPPDLLPANDCLWKWLSLPACCVVSAAEVIGVAETLRRLPQVAAGAPLLPGAPLLQLRDKNLPADERLKLARAMADAVTEHGGLLVVNDDEALARQVGAAGAHLSSRRLLATDARPDFKWVGASCHSADDLARAAALGLDYAVLSPVQKTLTHVSAAPLGWRAFSEVAAAAALPVYALGGLTPALQLHAQEHGAQGVAMMRQGWNVGE